MIPAEGAGPMNANVHLEIPFDAVSSLCRRHHICRLSLFGSILRDDFRGDSDVDVVVEFEPGKTPGFGFAGIQEELSVLLGRQVDLNTPASLSKYFRDEVLREAEVLYDAA
jgi:predicted nucleotidyltransferase